MSASAAETGSSRRSTQHRLKLSVQKAESDKGSFDTRMGKHGKRKGGGQLMCACGTGVFSCFRSEDNSLKNA